MRQALGIAPAKGDYWLELTEILLALERPAEALEIIEDMIAQGLDWPQALALRDKARQACEQQAERAAAGGGGAGETGLKLCLGGSQAKPGWRILNIQPGPAVDQIADIRDLTMFADQSCAEVYASHVLEHIPQQFMVETLQGLHRILMPEGRLMISVPDMDVLCREFLSEEFTFAQRVHVMRMMFGGQTDNYDFHFVGLNYEMLSRILLAAGFARVEKVERFGLFQDTSDYAPYGEFISLNVIAYPQEPAASGHMASHAGPEASEPAQ